ncbi:MAG: secretin N-terminal domain-containing protein, partial [Elusimicrobiota bacterium]
MAAVLFAELVVGPAAPAWAQRWRAEPEADPEFREQKKKRGQEEGGPIAQPEAESPEAERPPSESEQQIGETPVEPEAEQEPEPRTQGMQIGASSARRSAPVESGDLLETRIVVRVKSAPLAAFLDSISAQAKINFIITEGLEEKRITAFLQGVTVREALQILLEMKGLTYQRIGKSNTYVVSPRAKGTTNRITRIYTLSFIPLMDMAQGSAGGADQQAGSSGGGGGGGGSSMPGLGAALGGSGSGPAAGGSQQQGGISILGVIKSVLSKEHGALAVDARTNALIITDVPEVFPQVEQILAELDKKSPQIMIEAQIVEIDSDRAQNLGLEWGGANGELGIFQGPIRDTTFPLNLPKNLSNTHIFDPLNNVVSAVGQGAAGGAPAGAGGA